MVQFSQRTFLLACSLSLIHGLSAQGGEPVYDGKPLSDWARTTQDGSIGGAEQAKEAIIAIIGVTNAMPFLLRWIQPPFLNSEMPGDVTECFRIFGPEAKAAIPDLAEILNRQPMSLAEASAQDYAAKALSYPIIRRPWAWQPRWQRGN